MKVLTTPTELQLFSRNARLAGKRIALVPTMGNLHEGHLCLIDAACERADQVIVSIFVNPTQFGPAEDFEKYPRTLERDMERITARTMKETVIYHPDPAKMYAPDHSVWVEEASLSKPLCGQSRPIHFRGVLTVVAKLFNAAQPDVALFGQKDAQQALLIRRMIRDLDFPIELVVCPIVRESDGLALSSRNQYLSPLERRNAPKMQAALQKARQAINAGEMTDPETVKSFLLERMIKAGGRTDYVELVNFETLAPARSLNEPILLAVAVYFGATRLIDNLLLGVTHF